MAKISFFWGVYLSLFLNEGVMAMPKAKLSRDGFNQSVNAGTEVVLSVRYQKQKSYRLIEGNKPASETGWESHSTLTTGLFPLRTGKKIQLSYVAKTDKVGRQPVLWTEVRYFNQHGVNIDVTGGQRQHVRNHWHRQTIDLFPVKADIVYAEVWFVKYANGQHDSDNDKHIDSSAIYLSDIKLQ